MEDRPHALAPRDSVLTGHGGAHAPAGAINVFHGGEGSAADGDAVAARKVQFGLIVNPISLQADTFLQQFTQNLSRPSDSYCY